MFVLAGGEAVGDFVPEAHLQRAVQEPERGKGFKPLFQGVEHDPAEIAVDLDRFLALELRRVEIVARQDGAIAAGDNECAGPRRGVLSQQGNAVHRRSMVCRQYRQGIFPLCPRGQA